MEDNSDVTRKIYRLHHSQIYTQQFNAANFQIHQELKNASSAAQQFSRRLVGHFGNEASSFISRILCSYNV